MNPLPNGKIFQLLKNNIPAHGNEHGSMLIWMYRMNDKSLTAYDDRLPARFSKQHQGTPSPETPS
jgi:hypothetical protein